MNEEALNNQEREDSQGIIYGQNNQAFISESALRLRLDTSDTIRNIEMHLRGFFEELYQDEKGLIKRKKIITGKPLMNDEGIQWVMNFVNNLYNRHLAMGNFATDRHGRSDMYDFYIECLRKELSIHLIIKIYDYNIKEDDFGGVISTIMSFLKVFFTRAIDNKEREGLSLTSKVIENNQSIQPNKKFGIFG